MIFQKISNEYFKPISQKEFREKNAFKTSSSVDRDRDDNEGFERMAKSVANEKIDSWEFEESECGACSICFNNEANAVIVPCGHGGICYHCSSELKRNRKCHICRVEVKHVVEIKQNSEFAYVP